MMIEIGVYRMDVDVERTRAFYDHEQWFGCGCAGCRNYERAVTLLPDKVKAFFAQFGIDPGKPPEMSAVHSPDGKSILYDGSFYLCGSLVEGKDPLYQTGPKRNHLKEAYQICVDGDFTACFFEERSLLWDTFPRPAIRLNVDFSLPWLLAEPNPYVWHR